MAWQRGDPAGLVGAAPLDADSGWRAPPHEVEARRGVVRSRDEKHPRAGAEERAADLTEFWRKPDGSHDFATWLRLALEDVLGFPPRPRTRPRPCRRARHPLAYGTLHATAPFFAPDPRLCAAPRWPRAAAEIAVV